MGNTIVGYGCNLRKTDLLNKVVQVFSTKLTGSQPKFL